jgi:hypothetical protein
MLELNYFAENTGDRIERAVETAIRTVFDLTFSIEYDEENRSRKKQSYYEIGSKTVFSENSSLIPV